jgi:LytS/YehU family sensor histidine kinase
VAEPLSASHDIRLHLSWRLVAFVCAVWVFAGVVLGAQNSLGATLQGAQPIALSGALKNSLIQTLAWIPATIAAIALASRFPIDATRWRPHLGVHVVAAVALAFVTNAIVVLSYWVTSGQFGGLTTLLRQGALWMTLRLHVALLVYAAILAMTQAVMYYRRTRARELHLARLEGQLTRARLQALNAQIRPHFLFNTMHTIGQLWRSGNADSADEMLDRLGSLFHRVQDSTDQQEVPLADELDMVREYLAIEQARFPDRLRCTIDASADALETPVPPLILQPLVENAVRHGVSRTSTAGRIEVLATVDDGTLTLRVSDDGPGVDAGRMNGKGTGLRNTRDRLLELYGAAGRLDVRQGASGGTVATVVIPRVVAR